MHQAFINSESVKFKLRLSAYQETIWETPQALYKEIEKDIIFDKQFCWSTPDNLELAMKISKSPRFILCYRPILEVLASFVSKSLDNPNYYLNQEIEKANFYPKIYLNKNDALAEFLMTHYDLIPRSILGLSHAKKNEDSQMFKFVLYDDLVNDPQEIMTDIFDFMKVEPMKIKTNRIKNVFHYQDLNYVGAKNFHLVRPEIQKESTRPEDLFSDYILQKYNNALVPIGL
jgi:hypothetical protein